MKNLLVSFIFSLLVLLNVTACQSQRIDINIVGKCYKLEVDSYLYTLNYCDNVGGCYGIQAYSYQKNFSNDKERNIPNSQNELESNLEHWNNVIKDSANVSGFRQTRYAGTVRENDRLAITKAEFVTIWSWGSFWKVEAEIIDGQKAGVIVHLPDMLYLQSPSWLKQSSVNDGPLFDHRFLIKCQ